MSTAAPYRIFFADQKRGINNPADRPNDATVAEILTAFDAMTGEEADYIGICRADDTLLQFIWDEAGGVILDVPVPRKRGSLCRTTTREECRTMIEKIDTLDNLEKLPNLVWEKW